MATVDLDDEFIDLFYGMTGEESPKSVSLISLKSQLVNIVETLKELNKTSKKPIRNKVLGNLTEGEDDLDNNAILVVDDLGVITYQLKVILSQFDLDVDSSQEIYDAVNKFKKRKYKYVVMDLFIPTEREGFILLTELKKMASMYNTNTIVGIITASPRKEIEIQCRTRGADFFLEKNNDWQNQLCETMSTYLNAGKEDDDDF